MFKLIRKLLVRHAWIEIDDAHRRCLVCGRLDERDVEIEILGPNAWVNTAAGDATRHFAVDAKSRSKRAPASKERAEYADAE